MDELDLLIETMDTTGPAVEAADTGGVDDDVAVALEEFKTASNPRDQVEALKLLLRLVK